MMMENPQYVRHCSRPLGLENKTKILALTFAAGWEGGDRQNIGQKKKKCIVLESG